MGVTLIRASRPLMEFPLVRHTVRHHTFSSTVCTVSRNRMLRYNALLPPRMGAYDQTHMLFFQVGVSTSSSLPLGNAISKMANPALTHTTSPFPFLPIHTPHNLPADQMREKSQPPPARRLTGRVPMAQYGNAFPHRADPRPTPATPPNPDRAGWRSPLGPSFLPTTVTCRLRTTSPLSEGRLPG